MTQTPVPLRHIADHATPTEWLGRMLRFQKYLQNNHHRSPGWCLLVWLSIQQAEIGVEPLVGDQSLDRFPAGVAVFAQFDTRALRFYHEDQPLHLATGPF